MLEFFLILNRAVYPHMMGFLAMIKAINKVYTTSLMKVLMRANFQMFYRS